MEICIQRKSVVVLKGPFLKCEGREEGPLLSVMSEAESVGNCSSELRKIHLFELRRPAIIQFWAIH
jgi:hypothetical protein